MKKPNAPRRRDDENLCGTCGNELPPGTATCPFCRSTQDVRFVSKVVAAPLVTINLKQGLPTVDEAMVRMDRELSSAIASGAKIARIIHGWGSGGKGGAIRDEARRKLAVFQRQNRIGAIVIGEEFSDRSSAGRQLMSRVPQLRDDRSNFENPGITMVALGKSGTG